MRAGDPGPARYLGDHRIPVPHPRSADNPALALAFDPTNRLIGPALARGFQQAMERAGKPIDYDHYAGYINARVVIEKPIGHDSASAAVIRLAGQQGLVYVLDRIVPGYYQRLNAQGEVERSTCCDNTATEHLMMGKLMSDSMLMWTQHYKLDSYRFDLMGHQPRQVMVDIQNRLQKATGRRIDFVGEGWNFGEVANAKPTSSWRCSPCDNAPAGCMSCACKPTRSATSAARA